MDRRGYALQIPIAILIFSTSGLAIYQGFKSPEPLTEVEVVPPPSAPLVRAAAPPPAASIPTPLVQAAAPPPPESVPPPPEVKPPGVVAPPPPPARRPVKQVKRAKPTTCASLRKRDWRHNPWSWTCKF